MKFRMSSIQNSLESVAKVMSKQIESVLKSVASRHNVENVEAFTMEVLSELGLVEVKLAVTKQKKEKKEKAVTLVVPTVEQPVVPTVAVEVVESDAESEAKSDSGSEVSTTTTVEKKKKPVVSKKMKEAFLALDGATEDKLKSVMKAYKDASNVSEWLVFARGQLELPTVEVAVKEKKPRAKKADGDKPKKTKKAEPVVEAAVAAEESEDVQTRVVTIEGKEYLIDEGFNLYGIEPPHAQVGKYDQASEKAIFE